MYVNQIQCLSRFLRYQNICRPKQSQNAKRKKLISGNKYTSRQLNQRKTTNKQMDIKKQTDGNPDLYAYLEGDDTNIMETPKKVSSREKKLKQLTGKFGDFSTQARNGFLMGAAVGGAMGAIIGIWSALQTKKLILLPISIVTSGGFFGFIMMCGSIVRSDTDNIYLENQKQDQIQTIPFWKLKFSDVATQI